MNTIRISDVTMKQVSKELTLSFKEKIELAKLLDKLEVSVIELEGIHNSTADSLRIKSVASAVQCSVVAVPVQLDNKSVEETWNALREAKYPRLQVCAPVSSVQMEYLYHKKPDAMVKLVAETVASCKAVCQDVEFVADDATRSDAAFLAQMVETAIENGASTITVCDTAGTMLPEEFAAFLKELYAAVPTLKNVCLGVSCSNELSMADACAIAAVCQGAREVKTAAYPLNTVSLANVAHIIATRGNSFHASCSVKVTQLTRTVNQIAWLCQAGRSKNSPFDAVTTESEDDVYLTAHDDLSGVLKAVERMGYDLSEEDGNKVYEAFKSIAAKKEKVSIKELDAIVASAAMQVPSTYRMDTYIINAGNTIAATAHLKLFKGDVLMDGVSIGDGPIDAAFLAIESITGCHYELDDFQIQAVTEGREAMGQAIVKLRADGKLYSGKGISTDIVGASIYAYINALNKIVYEEESV